MNRVLMIDNYDSFTYNLVQILQEQGAEVIVKRNDEIAPEDTVGMGLTHLVVSPGPGGPREAGVSMAMIKYCAPKMPVLGVCLGHQAMAEVFGGVVSRAACLIHGKPSMITHDGQGVYAGLPERIEVGRYHSLAIQPGHMPPNFVVTSRVADDPQGEIMGIRHNSWLCEGVQFHPESVLTPLGARLIQNFLNQRVGDFPGTRTSTTGSHFA